MSEGSVNVESRTSSQDKRWTIMAALLGTNTAIMLFQGMEQEANPTQIREVALTIIAATLPFQAIYFLIYTFLLENNGRLSRHMVKKLNTASNVCQLFAYASLVGVSMLWYNLSIYVGVAFLTSTAFAMILVRYAMTTDDESREEMNTTATDITSDDFVLVDSDYATSTLSGVTVSNDSSLASDATLQLTDDGNLSDDNG